MNAVAPGLDSEWPIVAIDSAPMAVSRGQRIKQERRRRRMPDGRIMTQEHLAQAVGISVRSVSRIETDTSEDPTTLPLVEEYLGITDGQGPAEPPVTTSRSVPEQDESDNPRIRQASTFQLLAELAGRIAKAEARAQVPRLPAERVRWSINDAPGASGDPHGRDEAL